MFLMGLVSLTKPLAVAEVNGLNSRATYEVDVSSSADRVKARGSCYTTLVGTYKQRPAHREESREQSKGVA